MSLFRTILPAVALLGATIASSPALADPITLNASNVGQSYTFNFNGFNGTTVVDGLTASVTLTLQAVSDFSYDFSYSLTNTTAAPLTSRITSFGFNTDPTLSGASSTGTFQYVSTNVNVPNGVGNVDLALAAGCLTNCSTKGVSAGATGVGTLSMAFCDPITSLTLSDFFVRYQAITGAGSITSATGLVTNGSTSGGTTTGGTTTGGTTTGGTTTGGTTTGGTTTGGTTTGGTEVPEPGMLGMMGGALAAVALLRRRRKPVAA